VADIKKVKSVLVSVFHKENLDSLLNQFKNHEVKIYSTGGTASFLADQGLNVIEVEDVTGYPSILGGRVKTLHPKVFGGILARRDLSEDIDHVENYEIPMLDMVVVDLYPFEATVKSGASEADIIEKIDIGGISLIRAAAKNFKDVAIVSNQNQYNQVAEMLENGEGCLTLEQRKELAGKAFLESSHYDTLIFNYFNKDAFTSFSQSEINKRALRYGENPHQKGFYFGNLDDIFDQIHGKEISYNNLLDIEAAVQLIADFKETTFAILKHNNACGIASRENLVDAWKDALAGDPVSAFGGILITNKIIDAETAEEINRIFFEVVIAPSYDQDALEVLKQKKNRIILIQKKSVDSKLQHKSILNGVLVQEQYKVVETKDDLKIVTKTEPDQNQINDLLFANKLVKHTKSNAIVLVKNNQLCASGVGQTSRVDALKQAVEKANHFGFDLNGAVMASDAFFPFPDCVEIADTAGINAVIQPGGSIKDQDSIDYCDKHNMAMVFTGKRHFKH
jgi:phosphoribosylaminoimidazolecarboxamide formyltransferase/IMP cyclohydrolase